MRAVVGRLTPGQDLPVRLSLTSQDASPDHPFDASLDTYQVVLGGGALASSAATVSFRTRQGAREGSADLYVLTAVAPSGTRELRFRVVVNEYEPLILPGVDGAGLPERSELFAQGGRAGLQLRVSNKGVLPGLFQVAAITVPPGWFAGFPDRRVSTRYVGPNGHADLNLEIKASAALPPGSRATIRVQATSVRTGEPSELELNVENGGHMHVASASGVPRTHLVHRGRSTTWVARLFPFHDGPRRVPITVSSATPGWRATLSQDVALLDPATGPVEVTVLVRAPADAPRGARGDFTLVAASDRGEVMTAELSAQVTDLPRIYIVAIDALNEEYLHLDHSGTGPGSQGDWLMPRIRELMERGAAYPNASANLPSATDMNHMGILGGTFTGTVGVPMVKGFFGGRDDLGVPVTLSGSREVMRFGQRGEPVVTLFEGIRAIAPLARGAIVSGKGWVNKLLEDGGRTVQISATGDRGPDYLGRPERYVLGDPPSDPDSASDPPSKWTTRNGSIGEVLGLRPAAEPSDDYIMQSATRIIAHEDPEVLYVLLGNMDSAQHTMGDASKLDEWDDQGTPSTYDDVNRVNDLATREEILDTAREADHQVGRLLDLLQSRESLEDSIVVVTADHGQITHPYDGIRIDDVLRQAGVSTEELAYAAGSSTLTVFDLDRDTAQTVEAALERRLERRAVVYNRDEMQTGVDEHTRIQLTLPGELYSEFWADHDDSPGITYRWPSLFVFLEGNAQFLVDNPPLLRQRGALVPPRIRLVGGHGGPATQHVPLILSGPGIPAGVVREEPVRAHQIAPTLYELLGMTAPASVDDVPLP